MPSRIAPPHGWVILRKDDYFYPACILTESPRTYALIVDKVPYRSKRYFAAHSMATDYHDGWQHNATLLPIEDTSEYAVYAEPLP